ncbi:MAG: HPr(Ser) kinase/phosphatase [Deltaproteobacteria bacterium]
MPVTVDRFQQACAVPLRMKLLAGADGLAREIADQRVQKTGLGITGEVDSIHEGRIQILGETEITYFLNQDPARRPVIADLFFGRPMACAVAGGGQEVPADLIAAAGRLGVPFFSSELPTSSLIEETVRRLALLFSQTTTIHGVLVEVLGVGVLLLGRSGIGKSECALDLIVRGHRFVADDVIHLEKRGPGTVLGRGSDLTRHHMEIRGLGILNIRDLFGPPAIIELKKIELAVQIEEWDAHKEYDRLGLEDRRTVFLDVSIPSLLIPVSPARNLATIVEVAVRNHLLKGQGVFSAKDLVARQKSRSEEVPPG